MKLLKWKPDDPNQKPEVTICSWTACYKKFTIQTYYSHRTHTVSLHLGPLSTSAQLGMFYSHLEQLDAAEKWALKIINEFQSL